MALQTIPAADPVGGRPHGRPAARPGARDRLRTRRRRRADLRRLETGKLFAIDRSESGVDRTKRRNQKYVEAGRLTVRQIDLATLRVPVKRLNKVFAFNVNLFWVRDCADEVALLHERVLPGGRGVPVLRGQPPRAGAQHRQEGLQGPARRRLPGLASSSRRRPPVVGIIGRR